ncbi:MAG: hypothetical protein JXL80_03985 [Planctomycetes bacterium]|nr:hypothetical protein [Planctomycetota bacterium]
MPYLGDHTPHDPHDWTGEPGSCPDVVRQMCDQQGLYCPNCEYLLRGVEGSGLTQCPECGHPIDFDDLRARHLAGYDLGPLRNVIKGVLLRPGVYVRQFKGPQHYLRIAPEHSFFFWFILVAAIVTVVPLLRVMVFPHDLLSGVFCCPLVGSIIIAAMAHLSSHLWFRMLLRLAGRRNTDRGAVRIMYFASIVYLPLIAPVAMIVVATIIAVAGWKIGIDLSLAGAALTVLALLLGIALAVRWGYVAMLVFGLETYGRSPMLAFLAMANPVSLLVGGASAISLVLVVWNLLDSLL